MKKGVGIKLDDLKWEAAKIIGPPFMIFLEGDKIVGVSFNKEFTKSIKEAKKKSVFSKFLVKGKMKIKLV